MYGAGSIAFLLFVWRLLGARRDRLFYCTIACVSISLVLVQSGELTLLLGVSQRVPDCLRLVGNRGRHTLAPLLGMHLAFRRCAPFGSLLLPCLFKTNSRSVQAPNRESVV